jgi:hypothetical protein
MEKYIPPRPDCPNCGKQHGASMGSSRWGHNITCCSDECGMAIAKKLQKNMSSKEYKKALSDCRKADKIRDDLKYKGMSAREPSFYNW